MTDLEGAPFVLATSQELAASWRWTLRQQLATRDRIQLLPFLERDEFARRSSQAPAPETNALTARLLDLEARLRRRIKLSRRQLVGLVLFAAFLLLVAIILSVALGIVVTSPPPDPCLSTIEITSTESLASFYALQCAAVGALSLDGSRFGTSAPNATFAQLESADSIAISHWNGAASILAFPLLRRVGPLSLRSVTLHALLFPSLSVAGDTSAFKFSLGTGLSFPSLEAAASLVLISADVGGVLDFPRLETVTANLTLRAALSHGDVDFPRLRNASIIDITGPLKKFVGLPPPTAPLIAFPSLRVARGVMLFSIAWAGGLLVPLLQDVDVFSVSGVTLRSFTPNGTVIVDNFDVSSLERATTVLLRATFGISRANFASLEHTDVLTFDGNTFLTRALFPRLASAGDMLFSTNTNLGEVALPTLALVTQGLRFVGNSAVTEIAAPALKAGVVLLSLNVALRSVSLPALETGSVAFVANPVLRDASFPALRSLGVGTFAKNDALSSISMPLIETMSEEGWVEGSPPSAVYWVLVRDASGTAPKHVDAGELARILAFALGSLTVVANPNLTRVDLGASLVGGNTMLIDDNALLCPANVTIASNASFACGCFDGVNGWEVPNCNATGPLGGQFACPSFNCSVASPAASTRRSLPNGWESEALGFDVWKGYAASGVRPPRDTMDATGVLRTVRRLESEVESLKRALRRERARRREDG